MQVCLGHTLPSTKRDEDDNCAIQETAVNLALLLDANANATMTKFPSVEMDSNHHHTVGDAKKLLYEILSKSDNDFRWNVQLKERLHEVLHSMNMKKNEID